eukprot:783655-Rhodomonas_salina.2
MPPDAAMLFPVRGLGEEPAEGELSNNREVPANIQWGPHIQVNPRAQCQARTCLGARFWAGEELQQAWES